MSVSQKVFQEMATVALNHWDFEAADEPYASSKSGLEYLAAHLFTDEQLAEIEESRDQLVDAENNFDWDWLQEMAVGCSQR